jgi:8-oxo-dGTP diphosphatase
VAQRGTPLWFLEAIWSILRLVSKLTDSNMEMFNTNFPEPGKSYKRRDGVYAIILNNNSDIAIIQTSTGYFLPGGGIEDNETKEECLFRECLEEIGFEIKIKRYLFSGNYFFYSTTLNVDMENFGYFFECELLNIKKIKTEDDHQLVWLSVNEAIKLLYLKNQQQAVRYFDQDNKKTNNFSLK